MKTVFHKSGGRQMYQSAARSFRKESTASCRFLQEFIWAQAARAALRRLPRHSAARLFLPAEVDRLLGQHELEHQVVAGRGNAVLTAEAADSAGDDTDLGLAVMRDVLHHLRARTLRKHPDPSHPRRCTQHPWCCCHPPVYRLRTRRSRCSHPSAQTQGRQSDALPASRSAYPFR